MESNQQSFASKAIAVPIQLKMLKEINREEYNKLKNKTNLDGEYIVRYLPTAAMITAYASIFMNTFLKYPLDEKYVGNE